MMDSTELGCILAGSAAIAILAHQSNTLKTHIMPPFRGATSACASAMRARTSSASGVSAKAATPTASDVSATSATSAASDTTSDSLSKDFMNNLSEEGRKQLDHAAKTARDLKYKMHEPGLPRILAG